MPPFFFATLVLQEHWDVDRLKVGIAGASGYGGGELLRLLLLHKNVEVVHLAADSRAGEKVTDVFPNLPVENLLERHPPDEPWQGIHILFTALPAGESAKIARLYKDSDLKLIDLGPDFRFRTAQKFEDIYKIKHPFPEALARTTYALVEWNRKELSSASILSCPGCYPTGALMGILPFAIKGMISGGKIFVDGKSGVSGAGRGLTLDTHYPEIAEGMKPYKPFSHRHGPEMEEALETISDCRLDILFVPHLIPVNRGLLSTIYMDLDRPITQEQAWEVIQKAYKQEKGILLTEQAPHSSMVKGTNRTAISVRVFKNSVVVMTAIDNLLKGAAGQAVQAMNVACGFDEMEGLPLYGEFP